MRWRWQDGGGLFALLLFIVSAAISLVIIFTPLYSWTAQAMDLAGQLGMSHDQLMDNYHQLMAYLNFPWVDQLVMADFPSSDQGLFHFFEVKRLFMLNAVVLVLSAIGSVFYWRWVHRKGHFIAPAVFFKGMIAVPFVLVVLLALNFDWMFVTFHRIAFNNEAWIFNPSTDPIILALPQGFFMLCFAVVFILIEATFIGLYTYFRKKGQPK